MAEFLAAVSFTHVMSIMRHSPGPSKHTCGCGINVLPSAAIGIDFPTNSDGLQKQCEGEKGSYLCTSRDSLSEIE